MTFPCTACGACCRRAKQIISKLDGIDDPESIFFFPYTYDESGKCENLTDDNKCRIYENRPAVCNTEKMREYYGLTQEEYNQAASKVCNHFIKEDGISEEYLVDLE